MNNQFDIIKKPHTKDGFTKTQLSEVMKCTFDPIHFIESYIKVQHPIQGSVPLKLYDFQIEMVKGFHDNRFVIGLTARQLGKCFTNCTQIKYNDNLIFMGKLIEEKMTFRERVISKLENWLLKLAKK